jgi:hypothetical protein
VPAAHPEHLRTPVTTPRLKAALALAWLVCTAFVVTKAVHIDDAAHLAIADHIRADPLHPMSGTVFWGETPAPIHHLNQPHLFYYLLAGTLALTGGSLFAAHLLVAVFTALCALFAFRLGRAIGLAPPEATLGAALILLGPAFIPGQNLMTDVPMLALWLAAFDSLLRKRLWVAGLYVGLACLIKYTSLILIPILIIDAFVRGRRRDAWAAAVPVALLGAWSLFNLWDYGGVHLLGRPVDSAQVGGALSTIGVVFGRAGLFILTLGACCPFTVGALPKTIERHGTKKVAAAIVSFLIFGLLVGQGLAHFGPEEMRGESIVLSLLRGLFALNGFYTLALVGNAVRHLRDGPKGPEAVLLFNWLALTAAFVVVLSPFVAVRHVLLVVPAVVFLLLAGELATRPKAALVLTVILGVLVALGDARTASVYRDAARRFADEGATHFVGHWGFQYYAESQGIVPYVSGQTSLEPCDRLVRPANVDQQPIRDEDLERLTLVEQRSIDASLLDLPRTVTSRLGYYSVWHGVPYTFTLEPIETFEVYEVDAASCAASRARATDSR